MTNKSLILLHEDAIRITHPVFNFAPKDTKAIFIWDNEYLMELGYSLKRLVFIYECISHLPIDIIKGNTLNVVREISPEKLYIPASNNPQIIKIIAKLSELVDTQVVNDEALINMENLPQTKKITRFFQYWKHAEKNIFNISGVSSAKRN